MDKTSDQIILLVEILLTIWFYHSLNVMVFMLHCRETGKVGILLKNIRCAYLLELPVT